MMRKLFALTICIISLVMAQDVLVSQNRSGGEYIILSDTVNASGGGESSVGGTFELQSAVGQSVSGGVLSGGQFDISSGIYSSINPSVPTVVIITPSTGDDVMGIVTVSGTATHKTGSSWVLYYGPGTTPPVWKQISSGSSNTTSADLASWDVSLLSGNYTLKLESLSERGFETATTTVVIVSGIVDISGTVTADQWMMLGIAGMTENAEPVSIFGLDQLYKIYMWDPEKEADSYQVKYRYPDAIEPGQGFWVKAFDADVTYSYQASISDTTSDFVLDVKQGWNQISTPFPRVFPWSEIKVMYSGSAYSLTDAANAGIISSTFYGFNENSETWELKDSNETLEIGKGYFVRMYNDAQLLFDPGAGVSGGIARIVRNDFGFRTNITVESGETSDTDNYFGISTAAKNTYDIYDAEDPPHTPGERFVSLYFRHDDWTDKPGRYAFDIRSPCTKESPFTYWDMEVATDKNSETAVLLWNPFELPTDRYSFVLTDNDAGVSVNMSATGEYVFNLSVGEGIENTRSFKISVETILDQLKTLAITLDQGWNLMSVPLVPDATGVVGQLGDDLEQLNVFQFYDGMFYQGREADIQSGIGFWIYVSEQTQIDITGFESGAEVEVPIKSGWNIIGNPFDKEIDIKVNLSVTCGEEIFSYEGAVDEQIIKNGFYEYEGIKGYSHSDLLKPWKGYFIDVSRECELHIKNPE